MREVTYEKARDLGRLIGQTDEFKALQRARERVGDDREVVSLINRLDELEQEVGRSLRRGEAPPATIRQEYDDLVSKLQASPVYQSLVAAQANFDRILTRVNEEIGKGMEAAAQSRIILPS